MSNVASFIKKNKYPFFIALFLRDRMGAKIGSRRIDTAETDAVAELRQSGISKSAQPVDREFVQAARAYIDQCVARGDGEIFDSDFRKFDADKDPKFPAFAARDMDRFVASAETYLGAEVALQTILAAKLTFKQDNKGSGQGWHRDSYSRQFKVIIYLSDVSHDTGPFEYVLNTNMYKNIWKELTDKKSTNMAASRFDHDDVVAMCEANQWERQVVLGDAGSVLYADTRGLHRGAPINSGERYAITLYFIQKSQLRD